MRPRGLVLVLEAPPGQKSSVLGLGLVLVLSPWCWSWL